MSAPIFGSDAAKQQVKLDRLTRLLEAEAAKAPFYAINVYAPRVEMMKDERRWAIDQLVARGLWERLDDDEGEYAAPVRWLFEEGHR